MSFFTKRYLESILANDLIVDLSKIKEIRTWLLGHKLHFQAIVRIWFKELVKSSNDKKLAFMYLAYEVIWHSIKDCPEFVKEFGMYMEKVFGHLVTVNFDEKAIGNIGVFIKIWRKRRIFDEEIQGVIEKIWKARSVNDTIVGKELRKEKGCVKELPPHLTCSVCSGLLKEPVQLPCCKTSLCKLCAFAKLEQHSTCWFGFCPKSVVVYKDEVNLSPELALQVDLWKAQNKERFKENSSVMNLEAQKNVGQQINTSTKMEYIEANLEFEEKYKKRSRESAYTDTRPKADPLDLNKLFAVPSQNLSKPINNNLNNDLAQIKNEDFNRNGKNCNGIVGKREISIKGGEKGDIEVQNNFNGQIEKEKCEPQKSVWKLDGNVAEQKGHSCNNHWMCDQNSNAGCLLQWINPSGEEEEKEQCTVSIKDSPMRKAMKRRIHCGEEVFEKKSKMCKQNVDENREASGIVRISDEASSKEKKLVDIMRTELVKVCGDEIEEPVNIGTEHDGTLLFSSITSQFPGTTGLKYRNPRTNCYDRVRLHNNNFFPPKEGWTGIKFVCVRYNIMKITKNLTVHGSKQEDNHCRIPGGLSGNEKHQGSVYHILLPLPKKISGQDIRCHFEKFGEVLTVQLRKSIFGELWGNAFIKFAKTEVADKIIGHQLIGDQWCNTVRATEDNAWKDDEREIFVSQITEAITAQNLKNHFQTFGQVTDVRIPKPRRNFAFVRFSDRNVVASLVGRGDHVIKGVTVKIGKAIKKR